MADQDIIKLAQEFFDAHNAGDDERVGATLADDVTYHELGTQRRLQGPQAVIEAHEGWRQTFPDVKGTIQNVFASGNQALAEIRFDGTFEGDMVTPEGRTIPANGKRLEQFPTAFVYEVADGKITEIRQYFDVISLLQQIGAMP